MLTKESMGCRERAWTGLVAGLPSGNDQAAEVLLQTHDNPRRETDMNQADEDTRGRLNDALTAAGVDVRNLAIEVTGGRVVVTGSVPDETQRRHAADILGASQRPGTSDISSRIEIVPVTPPDSSDGRGRSPVTGTSADSAHESRHQLD